MSSRKDIVCIKKNIETARGRLSFTLKRSCQRHTVAISIDELAAVSVYAPQRVPEHKITGFINQKINWIFKKRQEILLKQQRRKVKNFVQGEEFHFLGKTYPLHIGDGSKKRASIDFDGSRWNINLSNLPELNREKTIKNLLFRWYRQTALEILGSRVFSWARRLGVAPIKISIKTQKTMWGCCHFTKKAIHLNWQIILSPLHIIDYVIIHELCHLLVPNHSKRFWNKVEKFMPDYKLHRQWLKENADQLKIS